MGRPRASHLDEPGRGATWQRAPLVFPRRRFRHGAQESALSRHPRRNQIRIRIFAAAVTVSDCVIRGLRVPGRYRLLLRLMAGWKAPRRPILGMVLAGDVESVGRNVTSFQEGDPVFGFSRWGFGAYAEEVCWPANGLLAPRPANLGYEEAAALPYGGLLAMHCLRKARLEPGQRVLIYGAS